MLKKDAYYVSVFEDQGALGVLAGALNLRTNQMARKNKLSKIEKKAIKKAVKKALMKALKKAERERPSQETKVDRLDPENKPFST